MGRMGLLSKVVTLLTSSSSLLPQSATNGVSTLGTLSAPQLPKALAGSSNSNEYPWGSDTAWNTNPYHNSPTTGKVRSYDWTISRNNLAPDGYKREMITINGGYPGPMIEANWGDTIQVTVHNNISSPSEGTAIHWHGFLQHNSQWMDGTSGFSQCPIAPGKTFTYSFKAELFGTSWYHAHYSAQYVDGVFGPIVIHGPWSQWYDIDLGPVMLNDYYHGDYYKLVEQFSALQPTPPNPTSDNNLINGKGNFNCSTAPAGSTCSNNAGVSQFKFQSGKTHRLRLINPGADATQQFSIDGHEMTVIANDFVSVEPYNTTVVTLGIGQRTDVLVYGSGNPSSSYWMRSNITCASSNQPNALAVVYYQNCGKSSAPKSSPWKYTPGCANDPLNETVPTYAMTPGNPATTINLDITAAPNASGIWLWYVNNSTFRADLSAPVLELANTGNTTYPDPDWNVYNTGSNSSYRIIVINNSPLAHPMHLHGHNFYVLDVGTDTWDGKTIINPSNPQRRDAQIVPAFGYLVIQVDADNPGAWPFHCHIAWHSSAGFSIDVLEQPAQIKKLKIPASLQQLCKGWNAYEGSRHSVPMLGDPVIDSGL